MRILFAIITPIVMTFMLIASSKWMLSIAMLIAGIAIGYLIK